MILARRPILAAIAALGVWIALTPRVSAAPSKPLTVEQDHQRMLNLLHIKALRPGVDGTNPAALNAVNQDEARAGPFSLLPDPLVMTDGRPVTSSGDWWKIRQPQLVELFAREEHGRVPAHTPKVTWHVVKETHVTRAGVPVLERRLSGVLDNRGAPDITVAIDLLLVTPEGRTKAPVVLEFGFPDGAPWMRGRPAPPGSARTRLARSRPGARLGLCDPRPDQRPGRQWSRADRRRHRPGQSRPAALAGRLGRPARLGLGRQPGAGLFRDRPGHRRQTRGDRGAVALRQGRAAGHGL